MRTRSIRRIQAAVLLAVIASSFAWLAVLLSRNGTLPATTRLPSLPYRDAYGSHVIRSDGARTLIMLFDTRCGHCAYELSALDRRSAELAGSRVYILTTEAALPTGEMDRRWPTLAHSPGVAWGTVNASEFQSHLKTLVTPAMFVFDERGQLVARFLGETKLDVVLPALAGRSAG
jgi:hypothetical protein